MSDHVSSEQHGAVRVVTIDDGKANALSFEIIAAIEAELELRIGQDQPARRRVATRFLVEHERRLGEGLGQRRANGVLKGPKINVFVVPRVHLVGRGKDRMGEPIAVAQSLREGMTTHGTVALILRPAGPGQVAPGHALHGNHGQALAHHDAAFELGPLLGGEARDARGIRRNHVVRQTRRKEVEPEARQLGEHDSLSRNAVAHDDVKGR